MKHLVTIEVRNPEWYWPQEDINKDKEGYEQWKVLNVDKVEKHVPSITLGFEFSVINTEENREKDFLLKMNHNGINKEYLLRDVTYVKFIGENDQAEIMVSNSILHSYMGVRPRTEGKSYCYFFIKENVKYVSLIDSIWISKDEFDKMQTELNMFEEYYNELTLETIKSENEMLEYKFEKYLSDPKKLVGNVDFHDLPNNRNLKGKYRIYRDFNVGFKVYLKTEFSFVYPNGNMKNEYDLPFHEFMNFIQYEIVALNVQ